MSSRPMTTNPEGRRGLTGFQDAPWLGACSEMACDRTRPGTRQKTLRSIPFGGAGKIKGVLQPSGAVVRYSRGSAHRS